MDIHITSVFWSACAVLGYTYLGYPLMLFLRARLAAREVKSGPWEPDLSVLVVAHDEVARIEERVRNLLRQDYPVKQLEIVVASDGSTDGTVETARLCGMNRVKVLDLVKRRGKSAVLNDVIPRLRGSIVVLADARQRFAPDAIRTLAACFADPEVGAASGELQFTEDGSPSGVGSGVGFYWKYEKFIRRMESRIDSTVGATGAIYAIRRDLFEPIPADSLIDDVLIPMNIVRRGFRVVFEPRALAYDRPSATADVEFARKVRTLAGNFQLFARHQWLLDPFTNRIWIQTVSHKLCRLLGPLCLVLTLVTNLLLLGETIYQITLAFQAAFYCAALGGRFCRGRKGRIALLNVPYTFLLLNWAAVVGLVRLLSGRQRAAWDHSAEGP